VAQAELDTTSVLEEYRHLERHERISAGHRAQLTGCKGQHTLSSFADPAAAMRPVQLFPAF
jgi:hypothetical protein